MRNFPNIVSRSLKKDANGGPIYVAYGGGETWYVSRASKRSPWYARPRVANWPGLMPTHRATLAEISAYLSAFDR